MFLNIDFANLKIEGYTALILSVIFTIISLAAILFFARHRNSNKILGIFATLVLPAVSVFCWIYLLTTILSMTLVQVLCISFACAIVYVLIAVGITYWVESSAAKQVDEIENNVVIESKTEAKEDKAENTEDNEVPMLVVDTKTTDKK